MPRYSLISYRCGHQEATRLVESRRPNSPDKPFSLHTLAPKDIAEQTYSRDECPNHSTKIPATEEKSASSGRVVFITQWRKDFERLHNQLRSLHKRYVDFRSEAASVGGRVLVRQPCHDVLLDLKLAKKTRSNVIIDRFDNFNKILDKDLKNVKTTKEFENIFDKVSDDLVAMKHNVDLLEKQVDRANEDVGKAFWEHSAHTVRQEQQNQQIRLNRVTQQERDQHQHQEEQHTRMHQVEVEKMVNALASGQTFVPANTTPAAPKLEFDMSLNTTTAATCNALEKTHPEMFAMLIDPKRQWVSAVGAFGGLIQVSPFNPNRPFGKIIPVILDPTIQETPVQTNSAKDDTSAKADDKNIENADTKSEKKPTWEPSSVKKLFIKPNWEHEVEEVIEESGVMSGVGTEDIVEKVMNLLFRTDVNIWGWSVCVEKLGPVDHDEEYKHPPSLTPEQAKLKERIRELITKKERQIESQQKAEKQRQLKLANSKNLRLPRGAKVTPFQYRTSGNNGELGFFEPNAPDKDRGFGERLETWRYGDAPKPKTYAAKPSTSAAAATTKPSASATATAATKPSTSTARSPKKGKNKTHDGVKKDTKTDNEQIDEERETVKDDARVHDKHVDEENEAVEEASETSKTSEVNKDSVVAEPSASTASISKNEEERTNDAVGGDVKIDETVGDEKKETVEKTSEASQDKRP